MYTNHGRGSSLLEMDKATTTHIYQEASIHRQGEGCHGIQYRLSLLLHTPQRLGEDSPYHISKLLTPKKRKRCKTTTHVLSATNFLTQTRESKELVCAILDTTDCNSNPLPSTLFNAMQLAFCHRLRFWYSDLKKLLLKAYILTRFW